MYLLFRLNTKVFDVPQTLLRSVRELVYDAKVMVNMGELEEGTMVVRQTINVSLKSTGASARAFVMGNGFHLLNLGLRFLDHGQYNEMNDTG